MEALLARHPAIGRAAAYTEEKSPGEARLSALVTHEVIERIVAQIPDAWLGGDAPFADAVAHRAAYAQYLYRRIEAPHAFAEEAICAHARGV